MERRRGRLSQRLKTCSIGSGWLVLDKALIERLAPAKSRLDRMPVIDAQFAHLPAQQNNLAIDHAWKIEQPRVQIFHLHANGIDLGDSVFRLLYQLLNLRPLAHHCDPIHLHAAGEKDAMPQLLQLRLFLFRDILSLDSPLQ